MAKTPILTKDGLVRYDENIKDYIDTGLENKVSKTDIVNNLVSTDVDAPLSAMQGKILKDTIDRLEVPGAVIYRGTIGTDGDITELPSTYKRGDMYRVATEGTYSEQECEVGDFLFCTRDNILTVATLPDYNTNSFTMYVIYQKYNPQTGVNGEIVFAALKTSGMGSDFPNKIYYDIQDGTKKLYLSNMFYVYFHSTTNNGVTWTELNHFNGEPYDVLFTETETEAIRILNSNIEIYANDNSITYSPNPWGLSGYATDWAVIQGNLEDVGGGTTYELSRADDTITLTGGDGSSSEVDVSDKVSKSGDTMTGDLTVKANINVPLSRDNTGYTLVPIPTAGTIQLSDSTQGITDVLTSYKSFMGSIYAKNAWNNIISTRHRNGTSDGVSHGMYLRSLMNNETPNLTWAVQAAGIWQSERAILDSGNYSTQIPAATQSAVGLMSAADKKKLDGIATGANAYSLPQAGSTLGGVKTTSTVTSTSGLTACPIIGGVPYYKDTNTTYTIDTSLSSTSTNPVQNKVVHSHMSARLQLAGGTMTGDIKFNNDKGIKDINGNWMLVKSSSVAATLGSIKNKYPIYVGHTSSANETTYVRGQFLALYGATCINSNAAIGVNSDKRVKTNESLLIDEIDKYNQFFDNLQPRKYNYIRDEEGKAKSIGFFAQEVHQALLDAGLTLEDFGGINIQESFLEGQAEGDDEAVWYQDFYSLAYDEFIPIIVSKIQYLEKMYNDRLEEIENDYNAKLSSLEERISKLEEAKA